MRALASVFKCLDLDEGYEGIRPKIQTPL